MSVTALASMSDGVVRGAFRRAIRSCVADIDILLFESGSDWYVFSWTGRVNQALP